MQRNELMTEAIALPAGIDPQSIAAAGTVDTTPINVGGMGGELLAILRVGAGGGSATVTAYASATQGGTYAAVTGAVSSSIGASQQGKLSVRGSRLQDLQVGPWIKFRVTMTGGTGTLASLDVLVGKTHYKPESDQDAASVQPSVVL